MLDLLCECIAIYTSSCLYNNPKCDNVYIVDASRAALLSLISVYVVAHMFNLRCVCYLL